MTVLHLLPVTVALVTEIGVLEALVTVVTLWLGWRLAQVRERGASSTHRLHRAINQLVQLAPIEPHATTGRAIINLDALAIGHHEFDAFANRAQHGNPSNEAQGGVKSIVGSTPYRFLKET